MKPIPKWSYILAFASQTVLLVCAWGFLIYLITLVQGCSYVA